MWNNFVSFYNWAMANGYRKNLTLDRINVNRNYCPSNCRWTTYLEQAREKRKSVRRSDGQVFRSMTEAERLTDVNHSNICAVIKGHRPLAGGYSWELV